MTNSKLQKIQQTLQNYVYGTMSRSVFLALKEEISTMSDEDIVKVYDYLEPMMENEHERYAAVEDEEDEIEYRKRTKYLFKFNKIVEKIAVDYIVSYGDLTLEEQLKRDSDEMLIAFMGVQDKLTDSVVQAIKNEIQIRGLSL